MCLLHFYLILFTSVPIMRHEINKEKFSTFSKRAGLSKRLSTKKNVNKGLFIFRQQQVLYKQNQHNSEMSFGKEISQRCLFL